jgi:hypothetical protein
VLLRGWRRCRRARACWPCSAAACCWPAGRHGRRAAGQRRPVAAARWRRLAIALLLAGGFLAANLCLQYGASRLPAHTTALVMLSEVVFASLSSVALGAAELTPRTLAGGALISAAAAWSAWPRRESGSRRTIGRMASVYDFEAQQIDGQRVPLAQFRGKPMLIVNTASACGFTRSSPGWRNCTATTARAVWWCSASPATSSARRTRAATRRSRSSARRTTA